MDYEMLKNNMKSEVTYSKVHRTYEYSQHSLIICPVWLNGWVFVYELSGCGFKSCCSHLNFRYRTCFEQGVLDIHATIECGFPLKRAREMIRTYSQYIK